MKRQTTAQDLSAVERADEASHRPGESATNHEHGTCDRPAWLDDEYSGIGGDYYIDSSGKRRPAGEQQASTTAAAVQSQPQE